MTDYRLKCQQTAECRHLEKRRRLAFTPIERPADADA